MSGTYYWAACADGQSQEHLDSSAKVHASSTGPQFGMVRSTTPFFLVRPPAL